LISTYTSSSPTSQGGWRRLGPSKKTWIRKTDISSTPNAPYSYSVFGKKGVRRPTMTSGGRFSS
jgi:hypothetical protein